MKLLLICDLFPPAFGPRMGYLCKYLQQTNWHPTVLTEQISDQTFAKMRQIIFKMMTEAGFLDGEQNIIPVVMDKDLANFIPKRDFAFFPMFIGGK